MVDLGITESIAKKEFRISVLSKQQRIVITTEELEININTSRVFKELLHTLELVLGARCVNDIITLLQTETSYRTTVSDYIEYLYNLKIGKELEHCREDNLKAYNNIMSKVKFLEDIRDKIFFE